MSATYAGSRRCYPIFPPLPPCLQYAGTGQGKTEHRPTHHQTPKETNKANDQKIKKVLVSSLCSETPWPCHQIVLQRHSPMMTSPVAVVIMIAPCLFCVDCCLLSTVSVWKVANLAGGYCPSPVPHTPYHGGSVHTRFRRSRRHGYLDRRRARFIPARAGRGHSRGCRR